MLNDLLLIGCVIRSKGSLATSASVFLVCYCLISLGCFVDESANSGKYLTELLPIVWDVFPYP